MTRVAPPLPPLNPFVHTPAPDGWTLARPDTRADRLLRRVQRFLAVCLVLLAVGLAWTATMMSAPGDIVVAAAFALVCVGGVLVVGWWMSILGARSIERRGGNLTIRTIGFFGIERCHRVAPPLRLRATPRAVRGRTGPTRGYTLTLEAPDRALALGFVRADTPDRAPAALAALLDAELHVVDPR